MREERGRAAFFAIPVQVRELGAKYGSLQGIQAGIHPDHVVVIPLVHPVIDDSPDPVRKRIVIRKEGSPVSVGAQVF